MPKKNSNRSLNKILVSRYKSNNWVMLGWPGLRFLAVRAVEIGSILGKSDAFETKHFEFIYWAM